MDAVAAPEVIQYTHALRAQDRLPRGVFIVPMGPVEGDQPVVRIDGAEVIVREGDWLVRLGCDELVRFTDAEYRVLVG